MKRWMADAGDSVVVGAWAGEVSGVVMGWVGEEDIVVVFFWLEGMYGFRGWGIKAGVYAVGHILPI